MEEYRLKIMAKLGQKVHSSGNTSNYNQMEITQRNELLTSKNQSQQSPMTATQFYAGSNNSPLREGKQAVNEIVNLSRMQRN